MLKRGLIVALAGAALGPAVADAAVPRCHGAASRAGCRNPSLDARVTPTPAQAMRMPNAPCTPIAFDVPFVCTFGVRVAHATRRVALLGDSHATHWRAALGPVAVRRGWAGSSLTRAGCPLSTATPILPRRLLPDCLRWRRAIPRWLRERPGIDTVFVSQHRVRVPGGIPAQIRGYLQAWRQLPRSVKRIVVIRDTPASGATTRACVNRAIARGVAAGPACAMPRSRSLHADPAATAARRARSKRVSLVDMTRYFCGLRSCWPVIGGVLVHKDNTHITASYGRTLAPFLGARLERIGL